MNKSNGLAFCGGLFAMIAINAVRDHEIMPAIVMIVLAIGCALRANSEWHRDRA